MAQWIAQEVSTFKVVGSSPTRRTVIIEYRSKVLWRSWLARLPVTEKVDGSSPFRIAMPL